MAKSLFMENTEVTAERSAQAITKLLVDAGATSIQTHYEAGKIVGIQFAFRQGELTFPFEIPARVHLLYKILSARRPSGEQAKLLAQAERMAWRQLFRWMEAQVALVQSGMVSNVEVFTPYLMDRGTGKTLYEAVIERGFLALPPAKGAK